MKVFIREKNCLAMFEQRADHNYWDKHWQAADFKKSVTSCVDNDFILKPLQKFMPGEQGLILEGGCGRAQNVYCMKQHGYNAVGIDFAQQTVNAVNQAAPELDVRLGDVRKLPFKDGEISGYWSLGVIEHFWEGYDDILDEMARVIRKRGFLFITFPYMSPLRKLKSLCSLYDSSFSEADTANFYQFCLDHHKVITDLNKRGFIVREQSGFDGIKGCKDEVRLLKPFLQQVYDGKRLTGRLGSRTRRALNLILEKFSAHCIFMVLENTGLRQ